MKAEVSAVGPDVQLGQIVHGRFTIIIVRHHRAEFPHGMRRVALGTTAGTHPRVPGDTSFVTEVDRAGATRGGVGRTRG